MASRGRVWPALPRLACRPLPVSVLVPSSLGHCLSLPSLRLLPPFGALLALRPWTGCFRTYLEKEGRNLRASLPERPPPSEAKPHAVVPSGFPETPGTGGLLAVQHPSSARPHPTEPSAVLGCPGLLLCREY